MPAKHPLYDSCSREDLARAERLLAVRCGQCGRKVLYLPSDLIQVFGNRDARTAPPFRCSKCSYRGPLEATFHDIAPGDYGHLKVRRPSEVRKTQLWKTVTLGESASLENEPFAEEDPLSTRTRGG